jgi:hypothetical protein
MEEINLFLLRLGIAFLGAILVGAASFGVAQRKGRDTVGWYLTSFFPALLGFLILLLAFPDEVRWWVAGILLTLPAPGILLALPSVQNTGQTSPRRPLRSCFLYLSLFTLLMLIVFGLIGYFCVPDEPRHAGSSIDSAQDESEEK